MENHFILSDLEFEKQFENCTFPAPLFSHEAHLRLAWITLNNHGLDTAVKIVNEQILRYATSLGAASKYNRTVTEAAVRAVWHFMMRSGATDFQDFIHENPRLKYNFKELLGYHYTTDIFKSEAAKSAYLEPELHPFD